MTDSVSVQLPVRGRPVTVAGSRGRAMSVTGALIRAGAVVTVISPDPTPYLTDLADRGLITIREREFVSADIDSAAVVFACTGIETRDMSIADSQGRGTILNDDRAFLSIDDVAISEGHPGDDTVLTFAVTLDGEVDTGVAVDYSTSNGTAGDGTGGSDDDYVFTTGTLHFAGAAGETQTISVYVTEDETVEPDESFLVHLTRPLGSAKSALVWRNR